MNSLESECLELNAAQWIDDDTAARALALERGTIFSLFEEFRFALSESTGALDFLQLPGTSGLSPRADCHGFTALASAIFGGAVNG